MDVAGIFDDLALLDELKASPGWQTARYHGQLSRAEVRKLLATARAGLVCFHPGPNHTESQPNKLFEYMSAGIPVIASDFPLWHKLIGEAGCGLLVDPLDPKQIAAAIEWVFTHPSEAEEMGKKGRAAVISKYNWEVEGNRLVEFYERFHSEAAHPDALPVT
jgi:glycosyltransferase involved in cell wall biosynthesis